MALEQKQPPISTVPLGLLDFLGIKNLGQYPQYLQGNVAPGMEMIDWMMPSACSEFLSAQLNGIAAPGIGRQFTIGSSMVVPATEYWLLEYFSVQTTAPGVVGPVGIAASVRFSALAGAATFALRRPSVITPSPPAISTISCSSSFHGPLLLPPGAELTVDIYIVDPAVGYSIAGLAKIRRIRG